MMDSPSEVLGAGLSNWPGPSPREPQASTYSKGGGGGAGAAAVCAGREQPATIPERQTHAATIRLRLRTFGGTRAGSFFIGFAGFADAADHGLRQAIDTLFFRAAHLTKTKFGRGFQSLVEAGRHFARRGGGQAGNQEPILLLGCLRFVVFALVADLHPIGDGACDDLDWNSTAELIEARLRASGLDTKIGLHFGAAARLHGHGFGGVEELDAALPEGGFEEQPGVDPADSAAAGAYFYAVVAAGHDVAPVPAIQGCHARPPLCASP